LVTNRPNSQRFLHRIETGHPDVVAVYDQSRSFRTTIDLGWAFADADQARDPTPALGALASGFAQGSSGTQADGQLSAQGTLALNVERLVDA
jgi:hypothetical protein